MNLSVDTVEVEEGPAYGGAILAAVACEVFPTVKAACEAIIRIKDTTKPDEILVQKYENAYKKFTNIYPALKEIFKEM